MSSTELEAVHTGEIVGLDWTGLSVDELATAANAEHQATYISHAEAVDHAIRCGEALNELRQRITKSEWAEWARTHINVSAFQLGVYMRLARHKDLIRQHEVTSIKQGARLLARTGATVMPARTDPVLRAEAQRLREEGYTFSAIGRELGVSPATARMLVRDVVKDMREKSRRAQKRLEAAQAAKNAERRRLVRTKGGPNLSAAYEHVRKALERLDAAALDEEDKAARQAISTAMHRIYEGEDAIIHAIGTSKRTEVPA